MLLLPYRADVDLGRKPIITLIVCAICVWVFARQEISDYSYRSALHQFCNYELSRGEQLVMRYLEDTEGTHYCDVLLAIRAAPDRTAAIRKLAETSRPTPFYRERQDSVAFVYNTLIDSSRRFERFVPSNLTDQLHFDPRNPTLLSMLTAAVSHGSWWHLISNLIFFFAFAASVEVITGYAIYLGFIATSAIGTHVAYSYSVQGVEGALPTVGLSGVVMAMMAFLGTVAPTLMIRCFFWFFVFIRTFRIPALAIAALYIVKNIFDYTHLDPGSNVNYVAHISGAAFGVALGALYRMRNRGYLRDLLQGI